MGDDAPGSARSMTAQQMPFCACQSPGSLDRFRLSVLPLCCLSETFGPSVHFLTV